MEQTDYQQKFEELFCTNINSFWTGSSAPIFLRRRPAQSITVPVKRVW